MCNIETKSIDLSKEAMLDLKDALEWAMNSNLDPLDDMWPHTIKYIIDIWEAKEYCTLELE